MDKLRTLTVNRWHDIDRQAEDIFESVSQEKAKGNNTARISGKLHKINRQILELNGFEVIENLYDYQINSPAFTIHW